MSLAKNLTNPAACFLQPANSTHRQYEALRAFFVDGLPSAEAARRFGYTPGSFRVLVHQFRQDPQRAFFLPPAKGAPIAPKSERLREQIVALRKKNLSIYDISRTLHDQGHDLSPAAVFVLLQAEGFSRLPRRLDEERPPGSRPTCADVADVRQLDLSPRSFRTQFGGLFLFLPSLATIPFDRILRQTGFPGSELIPAGCALRSLLALKLFGTARHSHVMSSVLDEGLALFAGLNVIPKRSFLTDYSCRIDPACYPKALRKWFDAMTALHLPRGSSFDLDFHTIPFHGENALIEKHYISKRSRRQKGLLAFLVRDATANVLCYADADLRKDEQNDAVLNFVRFWKRRTGQYPKELIFDSRLTTYAHLNELNRLDIKFITLRKRSPTILQEIATIPDSAWRKIELKGVSRRYKTPRILDRRITLTGYDGQLRQLTIKDLGHEQPTLLMSNQLTKSPSGMIGRYAQRMIIENHIEDSIDFFHMDALSSAVALKVNCDLLLTLMASSLYRLLGVRVGDGYETAKSRHAFRDFVDATAMVTLTAAEIQVRFQRRAHNPMLIAAGFDQTDVVIPWLNKKRLRFIF
jgi:transposase-like protein